jgi:hypothetical protein
VDFTVDAYAGTSGITNIENYDELIIGSRFGDLATGCYS